MKLNNMVCRREFLEQMPTRELDEMLQAELRNEKLDDDLVRLILDVLETRETGHPVENNEEITAAVEKYAAYLEGVKEPPARPARRWGILLKVASILVVVGLLTFVVPQAANAESFFEMLARWTDSVFEFFNPSEPNDQPEYVFETDHPGLQQIYAAVVELGITDPVVPMWIPEGYELSNIKVDKWPAEDTIFAEFRNDEYSIAFSIILHNNETPYQHAKDPQNVQECEIAGNKHYVFENDGEIIATWSAESIECVIATDCQEDIHKILRSIYAMEVFR